MARGRGPTTRERDDSLSSGHLILIISETLRPEGWRVESSFCVICVAKSQLSVKKLHSARTSTRHCFSVLSNVQHGLFLPEYSNTRQIYILLVETKHTTWYGHIGCHVHAMWMPCSDTVRIPSLVYALPKSSKLPVPEQRRKVGRHHQSQWCWFRRMCRVFLVALLASTALESCWIGWVYSAASRFTVLRFGWEDVL